MRKILVILFLLVVVVPALIYGYIWFTVKQDIDDTIAQLSPFAKIEYDSIHTSLNGSVGVKGLRVKPHMLPDTFHVGAVIIDAKSLGGLLSLRSSRESKEFPEDLEIRFEDLIQDLNASYMDHLSKTAKPDPVSDMLDTLEALGCGDLQKIEPKHLRDMGYSKISTDMVMGMHYDRRLSQMVVYIDYDADQLYTARVEAALEMSSLSLNRIMGSGIPRLVRASAEYKDDSYIKRKTKYCAGKNGSSAEEYIAKHVQSVEQFARRQGLQLSQDMRDGYEDFLKTAGEMRVSLQPVEAVDFMTVGHYSVSDLVDWLGMQVKVNGKFIENVGVQAQDSEIFSAELEEVEQKELRDLAKYRSTPVTSLTNYLGKPAKIKTKDGRVLEGTIYSISNKEIKLNRRVVGGGSAILPIGLTRIKSAEVFR